MFCAGTFNEMGLEMDAARSPVEMGLAIDGMGAGEGGLVVGGEPSPGDKAVVGLDLSVGGAGVVKSLEFEGGEERGGGGPSESAAGESEAR